jgi:hypothetical protein
VVVVVGVMHADVTRHRASSLKLQALAGVPGFHEWMEGESRELTNNSVRVNTYCRSSSPLPPETDPVGAETPFGGPW